MGRDARDRNALAATALVTATQVAARDRHLPVDPALAPLLPEAGLVRGRIVGCTGIAGASLALAMASTASAAGSWLALVDVPWVGIEAAEELGVALERVVRVDLPSRQAAEWAERVVAAVDGFELVLTRLPSGGDRPVRAVRQRLQARGAVLLAVDPPGAAAPGTAGQGDVVLAAERAVWEGAGAGFGHLRRRRVTVVATGRRVPRPLTAELWLPGASGRVEPVVAAVGAPGGAPTGEAEVAPWRTAS